MANEAPMETTPPLGLSSPQRARAVLNGDDALGLDIRRLRALNTVESIMDAQFRGDEFRVGFAEPPLGGTEAWLEEAMVPYVCDQAEAAGWRVSIDRNHVIFTAPPEDSE